MATFNDWDDSGLYWCNEPACGNDREELGPIRECPHCGDEMCFDCFREHVKYCNDAQEED